MATASTSTSGCDPLAASSSAPPPSARPFQVVGEDEGGGGGGRGALRGHAVGISLLLRPQASPQLPAPGSRAPARARGVPRRRRPRRGRSYALVPADELSRLVARWSKEEQSAALSTATDSTAQELAEWNAKYRDKFGFVFMICASGRTAPEVLAELKRRYTNRPIVELEVAAQEDLKITELRLAKLFSSEATAPYTSTEVPTSQLDKAADRIRIIGAHLGAHSQPSANKAPEISGSSNRTRPPITTHVLDVARGLPASGIEVHLEVWKNASSPPSFSNKGFNGWETVGSSVTNNDGRSGQLMDIVDNVAPGFYRISFNTAKYAPSGFFPYVSIIFEIKESQTAEHFHVPLLHSPFSFATYRGS